MAVTLAGRDGAQLSARYLGGAGVWPGGFVRRCLEGLGGRGAGGGARRRRWLVGGSPCDGGGGSGAPPAASCWHQRKPSHHRGSSVGWRLAWGVDGPCGSSGEGDGRCAAGGLGGGGAWLSVSRAPLETAVSTLSPFRKQIFCKIHTRSSHRASR